MNKKLTVREGLDVLAHRGCSHCGYYEKICSDCCDAITNLIKNYDAALQSITKVANILKITPSSDLIDKLAEIATRELIGKKFVNNDMPLRSPDKSTLFYTVVRRNHLDGGSYTDTVVAVFESQDDAQGYKDELNFTSKHVGITEYINEVLTTPAEIK